MKEAMKFPLWFPPMIVMTAVGNACGAVVVVNYPVARNHAGLAPKNLEPHAAHA
jgi:hypothetical protein